MSRVRGLKWIVALTWLVTAANGVAVEGVRLKDLGRIDGVRDNMVVGYGLVTGLAGTGDSARSQATLQSIVNALQSFGVNVTMAQLSTRNVAGVMVVATLPAYARPGDKLDVNVSSVGDARSLAGGTLLMMPLYGPDKSVYALAQGPLAVGGYKYELNGNSVQRNHPTAGTISEGATVEKNVAARIVKDDRRIDVLLSDPDYTTASRVAEAVNANLQVAVARAVDAGRVAVDIPPSDRDRIVDFVARVENTIVQPDQRARVVQVRENHATLALPWKNSLSAAAISARVAATSSGVKAPCSASHSATAARPIRRRISRSAALAIMRDNGTPAARAVAAIASTRSSSSVIVTLRVAI